MSGADACARNDAGASALKRAALADRPDAAEILRAASRGERPEEMLTQLDACLLDACQRAEPAEVLELLSRGADPERRDHYGETPLEAAERGGAIEAARALVAGDSTI
jgi:ankyrin repeat protein